MRREMRFLFAAGLGACLTYPLAIFAPLPLGLRIVLGLMFGPLLGLGSYGLLRLIEMEAPSTPARIAAASNAIAGALFTAMLSVQAAAGNDHGRDALKVWLGLDVAWDIYIALGTALFGVAMLRHPRFGRAYGVTGLAIAALLFGFNLTTFPTPPANAGLIDVGPFVGLWYLVITIVAWRSLGWAEEREARAMLRAQHA
jgi:hypothetical protein